MRAVVLDGTSLSIDSVIRVSRDGASTEISKKALDLVDVGRKSVSRVLASGKTAYGLNTGFGKFSERKIDPKKLNQLQINLIRSHAVGTGEPLSDDAARAAMVVRLNTLLRGFSGIRTEVAIQLAKYLNSNLIPEIPRYGSLGASGDLAPSAHIALTLVGEWNVMRQGKRIPTRTALKELGLKPIKFKEKEGLAMINGTQVMTGLACLLIHDAINFFDLLDIASALSLEALEGNVDAFDKRVHDLRPINGQIEVASRIRELVSGSELLGKAGRIQDPYSLRCIPQVHGAFREALRFARSIVETEINSVTDNPIIFPEDDSVISAGNFHGQPLAIALDLLGVALAEACVYSERRTDKLLSGLNSNLPLFLTNDSGLSSGMMVLQYTAASLISKISTLAIPSGLWNANVSAGQEDHASMGVTAALKAQEIIESGIKVIAIELICGSQAVDLLGERKLGKGTSLAKKLVRKITKHLDEDRPLSDDLGRLSLYLQDGKFAKTVLDSVST
jgi:histidine ammonia-lyase